MRPGRALRSFLPTGRVCRRTAAVLFTAAVGLSGCRGERSAPEIRIGLLGIMDGRFAETSGLPSHRGAALAIEERNAAGGVVIDGVAYEVRLVVGSYDSRADDAADKARALINQDSVHALIGPQLSAHALPVAVMAEDARVVMISPMSSNPATTKGRRYVFRLAFLDDFQGEVLGRFAREDLGAATAAVLYEETSDYSRGLADEFRRSFEAVGGRMVAVERFVAGQPMSFAPQLERIREADPDVLLLPNAMAADSVQVRQARELGVRATFLGTDTWDLQLTRTMAAAQGAYVTHQWHYEVGGAQAEAFLERFQNAYRRVPRTTAAMTYDATHLLMDAMARAGSLDADAIRDALANTTEYLGATGVISFQGSGNPRRSAVISHLRDGALSVYKVVDP